MNPISLLFAYGTLGPSADEEGRGWVADAVRGRLYDLGPYPALVDVDDPSAGWVSGHVRALGRDELARLDDYEGVHGGLYRRAGLLTRGGREVWVYVYARPIPPAIGPIGRWGGPRIKPD